MDLFIRHRLEKEQNDNVLILYVNPSQTEFSSELGTTQTSNGNMQNAIQNYIDNNLPDIRVKTIKIMVGTLMLSSFAFIGGKVLAAPIESSTVKVGEKSRKFSYVVQPGDTLYAIAKRFSMTVEQIKQLNNLSSDVIQIGQVIYTPETTPENKSNSIEESTFSYTIAAGDTLYSIAKKFHVSVEQLKQQNNLITDFLQVGQQLTIPGSTASSTIQVTPTQTQTGIIYNVIAGDTLYSIAKKFNISVEQLKQKNNLTTDFLQVSQQLTIPGSTASSTIPSTADQTPNVTSNALYTVVAGDNLYRISKKFNISVEQLLQANHLASDFLLVGQQLAIPQISNTLTPLSTKTELYNVVPGDSLTNIAKKFGSTVEDIKQVNNLTSDTIIVGQTIKVPANAISATETNAVVNQLLELGYIQSSGAINNDMSINGIKSFQNEYGLPITGVADPSTKTEIEHAVVKRSLVQDSLNYQGIPYLWGGTTTKGFDCSGFVFFMLQAHDIKIARTTSASLYNMGKSISKEKLQPGDLVFFDVNNSGQVSHVGFYVGNNNFISATSSKGIAVVSLNHPYWSKYYMGAKRVY